MPKSSLLQIAGKLNSQEFRDFGDYIRSPFFNKNESVTKLYDYIALKYPEFVDEILDKEVVFKKLFPGAKYNESFMKTLIFKLSHLAEDFLGYLHFKKDPVTHEIHLLRELYDRKIEGLFLKKLKQSEDSLEKMKYRNADFFQNKYYIQIARSTWMIENQRFLNYKDLPSENSYPQSESLIKYFLIAILKEYSHLYNQKRIVNFDFKTGFFENVITYLKEEHEKFDCPLLDLMFFKVMLAREKSPLYYYKIKQLFLTKKESLPPVDKFNTMSVLSNFATEQFNKGNLSFLKERFELHKIVLENKLYSLSNPYFEEQLFINIVTVGTLMKKYDWTENFIKQYSHLLNPKTKDNPYFLCRSRLSFAQGMYDEALKYLSKIASLDTTLYKAYVKNLTLMIYYEMKWDVQAAEVIDTYRHFLRRDNILPSVQRERYINFLGYFNDLLKLRVKNKPDLAGKLKTVVSDKDNVAERQWLLEKLDEF